MAQHVGAVDGAVALSCGEGHAGAGAGERREAERGEIFGRADVERIGDDEAARRRMQLGEAGALFGDRRHYPFPFGMSSESVSFCRPVVIEIVRREPALVRRLARRPLAVEHRKPGGVAVAALDDHVLAENPLEREAEALRGAARGRVEGVALPLVAAIAELLEDIAREQILRLGRAGRALHRRRVHDVADLDDAIGGVDAHQRLVADRSPRGVVDHREEQRIRRSRLGLEAGLEIRGSAMGRRTARSRPAPRVAVRLRRAASRRAPPRRGERA